MAADNINQTFERGDRPPDKAPEAQFDHSELQISNPKAAYAQLAVDSASYADQHIIAPAQVSKDAVYVTAWNGAHDGGTLEEALRQGRTSNENWGWVRDENGNGSDKTLNIGGKTYAADQVLSKAPEQMQVVDMRDDFRPSGKDIVNKAEELGKDPHRWEQTKESPAPKCNQYVEAVLQESGIPLPWKAGQADCHAMREALDKECQKPDSMWEKEYSYDAKHGLQSDERFTHYQPKDGDVIIWDKMWGDKWVQHSGITAEPYDILYAGSVSRDAPHGWRHGSITDFTTSRDDYGSPSAVYRYKGLK